MKKGRIAALMAAALVTGLVVGNVASGWAATATEPTTTPGVSAAERPGRGMRLGAAMRDAGGRLVDVVAELTGLKADEVIDRRAKGESFADIAESKGVSAEKVVDAALDTRKELLDGKVKDGTITQEQADAALERMDARLTDRVDSTAAGCDGAGGGRGQGGGRGRGFGGGRGAGGCGGACGQAPAAQ